MPSGGTGVQRIFFLMWGGTSGYRYNEAHFTNVMNSFLEATGSGIAITAGRVEVATFSSTGADQYLDVKNSRVDMQAWGAGGGGGSNSQGPGGGGAYVEAFEEIAGVDSRSQGSTGGGGGLSGVFKLTGFNEGRQGDVRLDASGISGTYCNVQEEGIMSYAKCKAYCAMWPACAAVDWVHDAAAEETTCTLWSNTQLSGGPARDCPAGMTAHAGHTSMEVDYTELDISYELYSGSGAELGLPAAGHKAYWTVRTTAQAFADAQFTLKSRSGYCEGSEVFRSQQAMTATECRDLCIATASCEGYTSYEQASCPSSVSICVLMDSCEAPVPHSCSGDVATYQRRTSGHALLAYEPAVIAGAGGGGGYASNTRGGAGGTATGFQGEHQGVTSSASTSAQEASGGGGGQSGGGTGGSCSMAYYATDGQLWSFIGTQDGQGSSYYASTSRIVGNAVGGQPPHGNAGGGGAGYYGGGSGCADYVDGAGGGGSSYVAEDTDWTTWLSGSGAEPGGSSAAGYPAGVGRGGYASGGGDGYVQLTTSALGHYGDRYIDMSTFERYEPTDGSSLSQTTQYYKGLNFNAEGHYLIWGETSAVSFTSLRFHYNYDALRSCEVELYGTNHVPNPHLDASTSNMPTDWQLVAESMDLSADRTGTHYAENVALAATYEGRAYVYWKLRWRRNIVYHGPLLGSVEIVPADDYQETRMLEVHSASFEEFGDYYDGWTPVAGADAFQVGQGCPDHGNVTTPEDEDGVLYGLSTYSMALEKTFTGLSPGYSHRLDYYAAGVGNEVKIEALVDGAKMRRDVLVGAMKHFELLFVPSTASAVVRFTSLSLTNETVYFDQVTVVQNSSQPASAAGLAARPQGSALYQDAIADFAGASGVYTYPGYYACNDCSTVSSAIRSEEECEAYCQQDEHCQYSRYYDDGSCVIIAHCGAKYETGNFSTHMLQYEFTPDRSMCQ
eukprot:gene4102-5078_t